MSFVSPVAICVPVAKATYRPFAEMRDPRLHRDRLARVLALQLVRVDADEIGGHAAERLEPAGSGHHRFVEDPVAVRVAVEDVDVELRAVLVARLGALPGLGFVGTGRVADAFVPLADAVVDRGRGHERDVAPVGSHDRVGAGAGGLVALVVLRDADVLARDAIAHEDVARAVRVAGDHLGRGRIERDVTPVAAHRGRRARGRQRRRPVGRDAHELARTTLRGIRLDRAERRSEQHHRERGRGRLAHRSPVHFWCLPAVPATADSMYDGARATIGVHGFLPGGTRALCARRRRMTSA